MNLIEYLDKSTVIILVAKNEENRTIISSGTGYFLDYKERLIITSLAHVTDYSGNLVLIKTDLQQNDKGEYPYFHLGGMVYYDFYKKQKESEQLILDEKIDFTFEQINDERTKNQVLRNNIVFKLEESGIPSKSNMYFFRGSKEHKLNGKTHNSIAHLELEMRYISEVEGYYIFKVKEIIESAFNYKGCSGAAVVDETGKLIGSVAEVVSGTKFIKVFPIVHAKNLIDNGIKDRLI